MEFGEVMVQPFKTRSATNAVVRCASSAIESVRRQWESGREQFIESRRFGLLKDQQISWIQFGLLQVLSFAIFNTT